MQSVQNVQTTFPGDAALWNFLLETVKIGVCKTCKTCKRHATVTPMVGGFVSGTPPDTPFAGRDEGYRKSAKVTQIVVKNRLECGKNNVTKLLRDVTTFRMNVQNVQRKCLTVQRCGQRESLIYQGLKAVRSG